MMPILFDFLRAAFRAGTLQSSRGYVDLFADRLTRALTEPTLARAMESLLRGIQADGQAIHPPLAARLLQASAAPEAPAAMAWLRDHAKLAALLAATKDETVLADTLAGIVLAPIDLVAGVAPPAGAFDVTLAVTCLSPLAHGADGKAGNATLFRRQEVLSSTGTVLRLPYYAGNAVRGQLRDLLADHFLAAIGVKPALWFFYALYAGGALEEANAGMKAIAKRIGGADGSLRIEGLRELRNHVIPVSLLGCALGNRVLNGRCQIADLRPRCAEWGTGDAPAAALLSWEYLTRREDREDHAENHSMIASTEVLKAGTALLGGLMIERGAQDLERACLGRGLALLQERAMLGAENRRGLGRVAITLEGAPDPAPYDAFLVEQREMIRDYLAAIGAVETAA